MPSWNDLLTDIEARSPQAGLQWLQDQHQMALKRIRSLRNDRNVLFYSSAFLQKPLLSSTNITLEDINGFMSTIFQMDFDKGITLLLHTPGGSANAAETIVAYLRTKFKYIEVIVPTYAFSAGTMIALSANKIIMGRQSQLGPIDPQMPIGGGYYSARSVVDLFEAARTDILPNNLAAAHVWAPVLQSMGPALLQEAKYALAYGEQMVAKWLESEMFKHEQDAAAKAAATAKHFNDASAHKSHGRRIDRDEARNQNLDVEDLEESQDLQDAVLTAYHLSTITFEKTPIVKVIVSDHGRYWVKNMTQPNAP
jgi:ClpP class serine protease